MSRHLYSAATLCALAVLAGCFENREAPRRLITCTTIDDALTKSAIVEEINLSGQQLDFSNNAPDAMPKLERLLLRDATIAGDLGFIARLSALKVLDISGLGLTDIPEAVLQLPNLEHLYFCDNAATNLSNDLSGLKALTYLNLDRTPLVELPASLTALTNLRWLRLNHTRLTALPEALGDLVALQRLYLRDTRITELPAAIGQLAQLEDIALSGTPLSALPASLATLPKLRNLDLTDTKISAMPENLAQMEALQVLSLIRCPISVDEKDRIRDALPKCHITF